jgi:hypothetical protein
VGVYDSRTLHPIAGVRWPNPEKGFRQACPPHGFSVVVANVAAAAVVSGLEGKVAAAARPA